MPEVFVGLGANLGEPAAQLKTALLAIGALPQTTVKKVSAFYRSAPIGPAGQPDYCNAVAELETALGPQALLDALLAIEDRAGRLRGERWGARVLDLDLLLYGQVVCSTARLTLPHPELALRDFVLQPLAEIAPDVKVPLMGRARDLLAQLPAPTLAEWA
ncbi:MAG: 2-amino-4-hydroxy-6-hydroxymethyldihydropteridine diphosphokinase [Stagnimonas sp.]|nr:2-amino-4-hydroxy-6-hydroxymethyldihydropteridine diphosphokinase [Stagnimonas sp.]